MPQPEPKQISIPDQRGVSLVEIMVAVTIFGLAVTGITTLLGTGRNLESSDYLREQASRIALNVMEDTAFGYAKYTSLPPTPPASPVLMTESNVPVTASLTTAIGAVTQDNFKNPASGNFDAQIDYRTVTTKVKWSFAGVADSVIMSKRIADVP